ncbi:uncharacterized protein V6R79_026145 [Siganus canaliculatus]
MERHFLSCGNSLTLNQVLQCILAICNLTECVANGRKNDFTIFYAVAIVNLSITPADSLCVDVLLWCCTPTPSSISVEAIECGLYISRSTNVREMPEVTCVSAELGFSQSVFDWRDLSSLELRKVNGHHLVVMEMIGLFSSKDKLA